MYAFVLYYVYIAMYVCVEVVYACVCTFMFVVDIWRSIFALQFPLFLLSISFLFKGASLLSVLVAGLWLEKVDCFSTDDV